MQWDYVQILLNACTLKTLFFLNVYNRRHSKKADPNKADISQVTKLFEADAGPLTCL